MNNIQQILSNDYLLQHYIKKKKKREMRKYVDTASR